MLFFSKSPINNVYLYGEREDYQPFAFTGLKGKLLLVHGLSVELRKRVSGAAEGGVHGPIHLVQAHRQRLPLLRHQKGKK